MRATFMPKPFPNLTGSGYHAHVSVWRDGANAFEGEDELGLSPMAYQFLGGIMAHAEALCALTNPAVNSYKRINAPVTASDSSRSTCWMPCARSKATPRCARRWGSRSPPPTPSSSGRNGTCICAT